VRVAITTIQRHYKAVPCGAVFIDLIPIMDAADGFFRLSVAYRSSQIDYMTINYT